MPVVPCVLDLIHPWRIVSSSARLASSSHMVLFTVHSVKIKSQNSLCGGIFPIALLELLLCDGVIAVVVIVWEDIMYTGHGACADMT